MARKGMPSPLPDPVTAKPPSSVDHYVERRRLAGRNVFDRNKSCPSRWPECLTKQLAAQVGVILLG